MKYFTFLLLALLSISCNSQNNSSSDSTDKPKRQMIPMQVAQYVTDITEDANGHLWIGTIQRGIARYDGKTLQYFTENDNLPTNRVIGTTEESDSISWYITGEGISKYDGKEYTNYKIHEDDFASNTVSQFHIDSKGQYWVGTWAGVFRFDGATFTPFPIPYPEVDTYINEDTKNWITVIEEDIDGNMWFARDGYGLAKWDGQTFTHYLKKDGLISNNVTQLEIDDDQNFWIGMRNGNQDKADPNQRQGDGGVNRMINGQITSIPEIEALNHDDVHAIYKDPSGNIWIGTKRNGVYQYDGATYTHYDVPISTMAMTQTRNGTFWLGGAGGLYRITPEGEVINVLTTGPWE